MQRTLGTWKPSTLCCLLWMGLLAGAATAETPATPAPQARTVRKIEPAKVCMANDLIEAEALPSVEVEGHAYYGCCTECLKRLKIHKATRTAVDPVSGKSIDKAVAIIGAFPDGSVLYFESEENLEAFNVKALADFHAGEAGS